MPKKSDPELDAGIALAMELFEPLGPLRSRRMFGGAGIYADGRMFALIAGSEIYLKVDDVNRPAFEEAGSGPFVYTGKSGEPMAMSYWLLPETAVDDADEALVWGRLGVEAALRARK